MPEYLYLCAEGHEFERFERMLYGTAVMCPECGAEAWRKPMPFGVNWNGLKPSAGELSPAIQEHLANVDRNRDRLAARHEWHEAHSD